MQLIDKIIGTNTVAVQQQQQKLHCGEVSAMWQHLVLRYDIRELTDIFQNFAYDSDFKVLLSMGIKVINDEISQIEDEMNKFGIPLPPRPPKSINTPSNTEILRDELMFRIIYMGIQNFVIQQANSILQIQYKPLQNMFIDFQQREVDIYQKMSYYGSLKGWLFIPPSYNTLQ